MTQEYQGWSRYLVDVEQPNWGELYVAVACLVGDLPNPVNALFDTASYSCILPPWLAEMVPYEELFPHRLFARGMWYDGTMIRAAVTFPAEEGEAVRVEATWFLSSEWEGPLVIGWKGCLDRMKWGFDSDDDAFYFAACEGLPKQ